MEESFKEEISGYGNITVMGKAVPVFFKVAYEKYNPGPLHLFLHPTQKPAKNGFKLWRHLFFLKDDTLTIKLRGSRKSKIRLSSLYPQSIDNIDNPKEIKAHAARLESIPHESSKLTSNNDIHTQVYLNGPNFHFDPDHLLQNPDGTIKRFEETKRKVRWNSPLGLAIFSSYFDYEDTEISNKKATLQIKTPTIILIGGLTRTLTTSKFIQELEDELSYICPLLSLSFREPIFWYQISGTIFKSQQELGNIKEFLIRDARQLETTFADRGQLIDYESLSGRGFQNLIRNFQNSDQASLLKRTILLLAESYSDKIIENKYLLAFSALDTLTKNIHLPNSNLNQMGSSSWKKLEKELEKTINLYFEPNSTNKIRDHIINKLPELKSPTTMDRVLNVCDLLKVDCAKLWSPKTFHDGLSSALKLRNKLAHGEEIPDFYDLQCHLVRLQILVERIMLKLLKWPDAKRSARADFQLSFYPLN